MCLALGKVPDVSEAEFGYLMAAFFIDGRYEYAAKENLAPFCLHTYISNHFKQLSIDGTEVFSVPHDANVTP
jgi:hypothetical protein